MSVNPYPIYIISLKRNPERRLYIQRQLDALDLDYQFVDAIDFKYPKCQAELCDLLGADKTAIKEKYGDIDAKQLATTLSHIKAYKLMAENNESAACILEDDAQISPDFAAILRVAKKKSWDILMLSSQSVVIRAIISRNINIRKSVIEAPQTSCSLFPKLRKTRCSRKLPLPPTPTSSSELDWTLIPKSQWRMLMYLSSSSANKSKNTNKYREFRHNITKHHWNLGSIPIPGCSMPPGLLTSYIACKIGALPIRASQQNLYEGYDIAIPAERPTSGMAYLLTAEMTKKVIESFNKKERVVIDIIPWHLYEKHSIKLRILTPPCVTASLIYLLYSNPRWRQLKEQLSTTPSVLGFCTMLRRLIRIVSARLRPK